MTGASLLAGARLAHLAAAASSVASQYVLFDRDESDSYRIRLEGRGSESNHLSRAQIMPALPVGSRWGDAVGWESYVVFPPSDLGIRSNVAVVALEYVEPHATRGAYPVFGGAIVPLAAVPGVLLGIALAIDPGFALEVAATYGVFPSRSRSPDEYAPEAAWLLRAAASAFADGHPRLVRTVVLTEDEVPNARTLLASESVLLGTVPAIRARFSWRATQVLRGLRNTSLH